jgi:hypothetical protein
VSKQSVEALDDGVDQVRKLMERWKQRLTLHNLRISERYLKSECRILVKVRTPVFLKDTEDFFAIFERPREISRLDNEAERSGKIHLGESFANVNANPCVGGANDKERAVFVGIIKLMESPQVLVPTTIRLECADSIYRSLAHSLYFSVKHGFVLLGSLRNRESRLSVDRLVPIGDDELPSQMVESGSKILQHISNDGRKVIRDRDALAELEDQISSFSIFLSNDWIWVGSTAKKLMDSPIQFLDVMFGPFDFAMD